MDIISAIGPASTLLPSDEINGYRPVNRAGEVVQNAFVDGELWNEIISPPSGIKPYYVGARESTTFSNGVALPGAGPGMAMSIAAEKDPQFHEWASAEPGHVCVAKRDRHVRYKNRTTAETAAPVIVCAQLLDDTCDSQYQFAGICRSKSIRDYDDVANGIKRDEYFTMAIGGPATVLNNSNGPIQVGDMVEWTFMDRKGTWVPQWHDGRVPQHKKQKVGPRRIVIRRATDSHKNVFGRAMTYAKRGEHFDVLIGSSSM